MQHKPLGPNGAWKSGQRVPETGWWEDQYGVITQHDKGGTFPPCIAQPGSARQNECAFRHQVLTAAATA